MIIKYGYKQQIINNLNNINNNTNNFYNFKGLNFLSKLNSKNKNLVISFHGAVREVVDSSSGINRIIFRGYNWKLSNTNIICISDYLLNKYKEYKVNWSLSTKKYNVEYIYEELFTYLINKQKYNKIVFIGSSAGGYPSLKFACKFNCIALIGNSQFYLEKYCLFKRGRINSGNGKVYGLLDITDKYNDKLLYKNKQIESIIDKYKPKQIIIYNNINDYTYKEHLQPLIKYIDTNKISHLFKIKLFDYKGIIPTGKSHHYFPFPDNKKCADVLQALLKK